MRCYIFRAARLFSAAILILVGVVTEVTAQNVSAGTEPAVSEQTACGPTVTFPSGSDVKQLDDALEVTLPPGYTYGGTDANGTPFFEFIDHNLLPVSGPGDVDTRVLGTEEETVRVDCTCNWSGHEGTCTESYNPVTKKGKCLTEDCGNRCFLVIIRTGGGDDQ